MRERWVMDSQPEHPVSACQGPSGLAGRPGREQGRLVLPWQMSVFTLLASVLAKPPVGLKGAG